MLETTATQSSSARSTGDISADAMPLGVEPAHVEQAEIRTAATAGAQDPGADRQRLDVVGGDLAQGHSSISRSTRPAAVMASSVGTRHTCLTMVFVAGT